MKHRLLHSFAWDFSGRVGGQFIGFFVGVLLARLLSPAEFGLVGMATVFIAISEIFTNLGLSAALIQRRNPTEAHYSSSFYLNVTAAFVLAVIIFFSAPLIAIFFRTPEVTLIVQALSLNLVIGSFSIVQEAWLRKRMKFNILTQAKIVSSIGGGLIGVGMAWQGFGVWSLVVQTTITRILLSIYYWVVSEWKPRLMFSFTAIKELWSYSFNLFVSGIIDTLYGQIDSVVIARMFSANDLGLYSRAKSLSQFVIKYSSESVGSITFPAMAAIHDQRERLLELGLKAEILVAFLSFGLLGWLFVSAESLIVTLLGVKWLPSVDILRLLCLSGFSYPISAATLSMLKASGDSRSFLRVEVWKKLVGLTCLTVGFLFGLKGFLISLIFSGSASVLLNMYFTGRSLDISMRHQLSPLVIYLLVAVVSSVATLAIPLSFKSSPLQLVSISLCYVVLYLLCNVLLQTKGLMLLRVQLKNLLPV